MTPSERTYSTISTMSFATQGLPCLMLKKCFSGFLIKRQTYLSSGFCRRSQINTAKYRCHNACFNIECLKPNRQVKTVSIHAYFFVNKISAVLTTRFHCSFHTWRTEPVSPPDQTEFNRTLCLPDQPATWCSLTYTAPKKGVKRITVKILYWNVPEHLQKHGFIPEEENWPSTHNHSVWRLSTHLPRSQYCTCNAKCVSKIVETTL